MKGKLLIELLSDLHNDPVLRGALVHDYKGTVSRYGLTKEARKVVGQKSTTSVALKNHLYSEAMMTLGGGYHPLWPGYVLNVSSITPTTAKRGQSTLIKISGTGFIDGHTSVTFAAGSTKGTLKINSVSEDGTEVIGSAKFASTGSYSANVQVSVQGKIANTTSKAKITVK